MIYLWSKQFTGLKKTKKKQIEIWIMINEFFRKLKKENHLNINIKSFLLRKKKLFFLF